MASLFAIHALLILLPALAVAQTDKGPPRIRHVYIPQDDLEAILGEGNQGTLLTREEFDELWEKAQGRGELPALPPADAVLTQARYEAELADDELRITARLQLAKLTADWQTVELQFGGVAVEAARINDQPAELGRNPNGSIVWVLRDKGRYELVMALSAPLIRTGGDLTAWLQLPRLPSSELLLRLPAGKQVRVSGIEVKPETTADGQQSFRIPIDKSGQVPLAVLDQIAAAKRQPLVFVRTDWTGSVEPAGVRWQADVSLDVAAQAADQFRFTLPADVEVAGVEAPDLAGWRIADGDLGRSVLMIEFRQPFQGARAVRLRGLAPIQLGKAWSMPTLSVVGAVSHTGEIALDPAVTLRMQIGEMKSVRRLPVVAAGASLESSGATPSVRTSASRLRFAFWHEQFVLELLPTARSRELAAAIASLVDVDRRGLALRASITIEPRYAPLFDVALELPRDWTVISLLAADKPVAWDSADLGQKREQAVGDSDARAGGARSERSAMQLVRFDLAEPVTPGNTVTLSVQAELHPRNWLEPEGELFTIALPEVRLVGVTEVEGNLMVESPREIELRTSDVSPDLEPIPPAPGPTAAEVGTALAYHYQDDAAVTGNITARLKPAQVSVETLAFAALGRESLSMYYQADVQISGGQVRSFDFTLPASVGEKIQITPLDQPVRVIEKQHKPVASEPPGTDSLLLWHVVLDRPISGRLVLAVSFEMPLSEMQAEERVGRAEERAAGEQGRGGAAEREPRRTDSPQLPGSPAPLPPSLTSLPLPVLEFRNVTRQAGFMAIEAAPDQEVEQFAESLREVDPADLPNSLVYQPGRIVAAYQYQRLPYQLRLAGQRRDAQEVLAAVCDKATITSVVSREGMIRHHVSYSLRSLGVQHLAVQLPAGATLWSVMLDGQPIEVRRSGGKQIVPLPAGGPKQGAGQHTVELMYETQFASNGGGSAGERAPASSTVAPRRRPNGTEAVEAGTAALMPASRLVPQTIRQTAPVVNMKVLELSWNVHLPNGTVLVSTEGDWKPTAEPTRPSLVARLRNVIAENSITDLNLKFMLLAGACAAAGIVWMLAQSRGILAIVLVVAFIGVLIALLMPAGQAARDRARATAARNELKQIGLAIKNYEGARGAMGVEDSDMNGTDETGLIFRNGTVRYRLPAPVSPREVDEQGRRGEARLRSDHEGGSVMLEGLEHSPSPHRGAVGIDAGAVSEPLAAAGTEPSTLPGTVSVQRPTPAVPGRTAGPVGQRARLSLTMNLDTHGWQGIGFTAPDGAGELVLRVQDDTLARTLAWLVTAATVLVAWLLRRRSRAAQAGWAAIALLVPMGLSGLLPLAWTLVLDGLFRGGLCAIAIWILYALVQRLAQKFAGWSDRAKIVTTAAAFLLFASTSAFGQAEKATPESKAVTRTKPAAAAAATASAALSTVPAATPLESKPFTLYVPYDPKNGDPRDSRWVYVPYDQFQRLWKLANPDKPVEPPPGVTAVVAEVGYAGRIEGDVVRFDGRFVVHSFLDKWTRVGLPLGAVALEKVELDGEPATVEERVEPTPSIASAEHQGEAAPAARLIKGAEPAADRLAIYVETAGVHVVDVRFSLPMTRLGATGRFTIPLHPAAAGRLSFELPAPDLDVEIEGAPGGWRRSQNARESVTLPIGGAGDVTIRWKPRRQDVPINQLISVDQALLVDVQDSGIHLRGQFHYRVAQGAVRKLELRVPAGLAVRMVSGPDVADWSVAEEAEQEAGEKEAGEQGRGGAGEKNPAASASPSLPLSRAPLLPFAPLLPGAGPAPPNLLPPSAAVLQAPSASTVRRLVIALKAETRTGTDIGIDAYMIGQDPIGLVAVRTLEPLGVTRETGRIVIGCSGQFHVRIAGTTNLSQIEREGVKVPASTDSLCELLSAYRYTARPWSLDAVIERVQPRLAVSGRTAAAVHSDRVTLHAAIEAEVGDSPLGSLRLQLPAGLRLSRVVVPPGADWFLGRGDDQLALFVELDQPRIGKLSIELIGMMPRDPQETIFRVPVVTVSGADSEIGQLAIVLDSDLDGQLRESGGARSIAPGELTGALKEVSGASRLFAFQYIQPPDGLSLLLSPAATQLTADVATTVSVREGSLAYLSEIDFDIRGASRSELQFTTPDWLGSDIEVQGAGIRQTRAAEGPAGRRTWTVTLQQPVRGKYQLHLLQVLPLPADSRISAAIVEPLEADPIRSYVILENRSAAELTLDERDTRGVSMQPVSDVPVPVTDELRRRAISAHKVSDAQSKLVWQRHEREQEKAIAASVNLADLITVVHRDGTYRTQAAYVVTNRTQQFLEFALPAGSQLWAAYVAGQPVRPAMANRFGRDLTLVPLEKISVGDISAQVVLVFSGNLGAKLSRWTRLVPLAPEIIGNVPVARTLWTVYTPDDFYSDLVENESNMTKVEKGDLLIARNLSFFEEASEILRVAKFSPNAKAKSVACDNLKQIGLALPAFQRPTVAEDSGLPMENRQWFRAASPTTIASHLEMFCCPSDPHQRYIQLGKVSGKESWNLVQQEAGKLQSEIARLDIPAAVDAQTVQPVQIEDYFSKPEDSAASHTGVMLLPYMDGAESYDSRVRQRARFQAGEVDEKEMRRGKLIEQNIAAVDKLKEEQGQTRASQESASPGTEQRAQPEVKQALAGAATPLAMAEVAGGGAAGFPGQLGPADVTARAGVQSIEITIPQVGRPQHFMMLLGKPKLTLSARHHDVTRWSASGIWAVLCFMLIGVVIYALSRAQFAVWFRRGWPWLAAVLGVAWLFLLPLGLGGLGLVVVGLAVLAWRTRYVARITDYRSLTNVGRT